MEMEHFKSFSALLKNAFTKRTVDNNNDKVNWLKIAWLRYDDNFGIVQFKNSLDIQAPFRILNISKSGKTRAGKKPINSSHNDNIIILPQKYNKPVPIHPEKKTS